MWVSRYLVDGQLAVATMPAMTVKTDFPPQPPPPERRGDQKANRPLPLALLLAVTVLALYWPVGR